MNLKYHKQFEKFIHKQNDILYKKIEEQVQLIIENPQNGALLEHPFRRYSIRKVKFVFGSTEYRIAYIIQSDSLYFLAIGTRENFYEKLKNMVS